MILLALLVRQHKVIERMDLQMRLSSKHPRRLNVPSNPLIVVAKVSERVVNRTQTQQPAAQALRVPMQSSDLGTVRTLHLTARTTTSV